MPPYIKILILSASYIIFDCAAAVAETRQFMGMRGLNTIPDARLDEARDVTFTLSHANPYTHGAIGAQFTEHVYVQIRQSAESANPLEAPRRLYPGIDTKIKLWDETAYLPQVAIGLQSAFGHKRMAGEYLALSKRWHDFDVTGGLGWGQFAQKGHIKNPLKVIPHFTQDRDIDGDDANGPGDWFTGDKIGFFGGLSYELPVNGLTLTADYNAHRYLAETNDTGFDAAAPWSLGLQYQPYEWLNAGIGLMGGEQVMARVTLLPSLSKWPLSAAQLEPMPTVSINRPDYSSPQQVDIDAQEDGRQVTLAKLDETSTEADVRLLPHESSPAQIGRAARYVMNNTAGEVGEISVRPRFAGLQGNVIRMVRRDLEQAFLHKTGSAEEIWQTKEFGRSLGGVSAFKGIQNKTFGPNHIIFETHLGLSEEDQGALYRTSLILEEQQELWRSFIAGGAIRFDLSNNLDHLNAYRYRSVLPVKSNVDIFADHTVSIDRMYLGWLKTVSPDLHIGVSGGYLEEMYAGVGGEVLYRPFGKSWAVGAEAWEVIKRDPFSDFNQGLTVDHLMTGHLQAWYRPPVLEDTTFQVRVGRYLAEDLGATFALTHEFKNGAELSGFVTISETSDYDVFGDTTHLHHGLTFSLPIGSLAYVPRNSRIDVKVEPFGRDSGQALNKPLSLYDLTDAFSLQHIAGHWGDIIPERSF